MGVGTPEVLVIAAVGYFLLGPEELYRLSKEIGKVVGQAREYVTKSAAEWQATLDGETFEFKEVKEIQAAAQELQDAFNFRSARYSNDYSNFNTGEEQNYTPPEESENPQLDVDDWNAKIMANEAAAAPAASQMSAAPPAAAVAAPTLTGTKAERSQFLSSANAQGLVRSPSSQSSLASSTWREKSVLNHLTSCSSSSPVIGETAAIRVVCVLPLRSAEKKE